jgi:antitoxin MazE
MQAVVKKWGNSAALRLPVALINQAGLKLNMAVDLREENGCIVVSPAKAPQFLLEDLLAGITPANLHGEVDFGRPKGKEAF